MAEFWRFNPDTGRNVWTGPMEPEYESHYEPQHYYPQDPFKKPYTLVHDADKAALMQEYNTLQAQLLQITARLHFLQAHIGFAPEEQGREHIRPNYSPTLPVFGDSPSSPGAPYHLPP